MSAPTAVPSVSSDDAISSSHSSKNGPDLIPVAPSAKEDEKVPLSSSISVARIHPAYKRCHEAYGLVNTNQFSALKIYCDLHIKNDVMLAGICSWEKLIHAATSANQSDLNEALTFVWALEKRVSYSSLRPKDHHSYDEKQPQLLHPIAQTLLQADTYLVGGILQVLLESYVKGLWNINKAWSMYGSALKSCENAAHQMSFVQTPTAEALSKWEEDRRELAELKGWSLFGEGWFNCFMSMLPPTVARIGSWMGFSGDRSKGIRYLTECYSHGPTPPFYATFAAGILCNFLIGLITYMQEREDMYLPATKAALQWGQQHHPTSVLFVLIEARLLRHERRVEDATRLAEQCITKFHEGGLPPVSVLFNVFTGWCEIFAGAWEAAAASTNRMVHLSQYPLGYYDSSVDYVSNRAPWTSAQINALDTKGTRLAASRLNSQAFYSLLTALSHFHLWFLAKENEEGVAGSQRSESKIEESDPSQAPSPAASPNSSDSAVASASPSPSPSSPSSSSSSPRSPSQEELNIAFFYVQNALTLLDSRRYKPMDIYTKRKSLEILARPLAQQSTLLWLDTCELLLKWNGAQQMNRAQIEMVLGRLTTLQKHVPAYFSDIQRANLHLYQGAMLRGLSALLPKGPEAGNEFHHAALEQLKKCLEYESVMLASPQVKVEGTLSFVYYEYAIISFEMHHIGQAKEFMKKSAAIKDFDQSNVMQVRNHALAKMIKEYKLQHPQHAH